MQQTSGAVEGKLGSCDAEPSSGSNRILVSVSLSRVAATEENAPESKLGSCDAEPSSGSSRLLIGTYTATTEGETIPCKAGPPGCDISGHGGSTCSPCASSSSAHLAARRCTIFCCIWVCACVGSAEVVGIREPPTDIDELVVRGAVIDPLGTGRDPAELQLVLGTAAC